MPSSATVGDYWNQRLYWAGVGVGCVWLSTVDGDIINRLIAMMIIQLCNKQNMDFILNIGVV